MFQPKLLYWYWKLFSRRETFLLYRGRSAFQALTIKYQPRIHFLGMFSDGKFMAGYNTKTGLPWNSPYFLADFYVQNVKRVLFLGGGPCCAPTVLWRRDKTVWIDVVEYDPLTITLAHQFFGFSREKRISVFIENALTFMPQAQPTYDVIFFDLGFTYDRRHSRDYRFCQSVATLRKLKLLVRQQGIVIYVVIANRVHGERLFLKSLTNKLRQYFHHVDLYVDYPQSDNKIQSHVFILSNKKLLDLAAVRRLSNLPDQWGEMYRELWRRKILLSRITQ